MQEKLLPNPNNQELLMQAVQVKIEDLSPVEKKLVVKVAWPLVAARLTEAYQEITRMQF